MSIQVILNQERGKGVVDISGKIPTSTTGKAYRHNELLDMIDAMYVVPFLMGSGSAVGRGLVGPGFKIVPYDVDSNGAKLKMRRIRDFMNYVSPNQRNIKDSFGALAKLYTTAMMFRIIGSAAWEIVEEEGTGRPLGFDLIPGVVRPNIEPDGTFRRPAYRQYLRYRKSVSVSEFNDPRKVIFFGVPDIGSGVLLSESLSLAEYTLPSEIYSARSFRALHENRSAPYDGFWYTPGDIDDDTFESFVAMIRSRYSGAENYGKSPIIMKGDGGFKSIATDRDDAPYVQGREINRKEISAGTGVPGEKYGVGLEDAGTGMKEIRREFYESILAPVTAILEEVMYNRICVGLFNAPEWKIKFNRPDFTTAVEDASIELRRIQWGTSSPNEARIARGERPRDGGDYYLIPSNMTKDTPGDAKPGRPIDDPVDEDSGNMKPEDEDPVPGTQPPERPNDGKIISELLTWKRFALRVADGKRHRRDFVPENIPDSVAEIVHSALDDSGDDPKFVREFFDALIDVLGANDE